MYNQTRYFYGVATLVTKMASQKVINSYLCLDFADENTWIDLASLDDGTDFVLVLLCIRRLIRRREFVPKVLGFVEEIIPAYSNIDFRQDFRRNRKTYDTFIQKLEPFIKYEDRELGKRPLSAQKQLLIYLWYLANLDSIREIARLFGVCKFTVHRCIRRVSQAICSSPVLEELIRWPTPAEQQAISDAIENVSMIKGCLGFIDGTHIRLTSILNKDTDYINRKGFPSVQLQLIVDDSMIIRDTYCGWPGCTHDARVYRNSPVFQKFEQTPAEMLAIPDAFIIGNIPVLYIYEREREKFFYSK